MTQSSSQKGTALKTGASRTYANIVRHAAIQPVFEQRAFVRLHGLPVSAARTEHSEQLRLTFGSISAVEHVLVGEHFEQPLAVMQRLNVEWQLDRDAIVRLCNDVIQLVPASACL